MKCDFGNEPSDKGGFGGCYLSTHQKDLLKDEDLICSCTGSKRGTIISHSGILTLTFQSLVQRIRLTSLIKGVYFRMYFPSL